MAYQIFNIHLINGNPAKIDYNVLFLLKKKEMKKIINCKVEYINNWQRLGIRNNTI